MEKGLSGIIARVSAEEWSEVPERVAQILEEIVIRNEELEKRLTELLEEIVNRQEEQEKKLTELRNENALLKEQVSKTSGNSSKPPSQDPPAYKPNRKEASGKKRGGQAGHQGHERKLYGPEECQEIREHAATECSECGKALDGSGRGEVYRHQVVEVPPIAPLITEHQFYAITCPCCGKENQAPEMSAILNQGEYGPRAAAYVGLFSSQYRQSYRQIQKIMAAVFGIEMSLGTINRLRNEVSAAVSAAVDEAIDSVKNEPVVGVDETGFKQRNGDGQNPSCKSGWLWVVVTPLVICFQMILSRSTNAAQQVLGEAFAGLLITDRCPGYNWVKLGQRQLCWAHLKRDFIQISERTGVSAEIGQSLLEQEKALFNLWHQFRERRLTRPQLQQAVVPIQQKVLSILQEAADMQIVAKEKTPLAKTVRTCRNLLQVETAFWLFIREEGVEPTNNDAERAIRPAVIWRRTSFGSDSAAGSLFVSRLLSVVSTLNCQQRSVLDFLVDSVIAARQGLAHPSLLP